MGRRIHIAFLWHMHQPPYEDPKSKVFLLPWTYLHATKDYYDMGALVQRHPDMRININFTPCLLLQLTQYATNAIGDHLIEVMLRDTAELTVADREFLLRTCFGVHPESMIGRFPRYRQLHDFYRAYNSPSEAARHFPSDDFLDLSVLFLLVWCGPTLSADPRVRAIAAKVRDFTTEDRDTLLDLGRDLIGRIVPLYRGLSASGIVELSTSPFYHPLTPLLIDNSCALEASPHLKLPHIRMEAQEEAERQVRTGMDYFESVFGLRPAGIWPPEGAVSEKAVQIFSESGARWIATDEAILHQAVGGEATLEERLRPHRVNGTTVFFRDRMLSDHIGFVYSRWPVQASVDHFIGTLRQYSETVNCDDAIVLIALDGENAWEYYPDGGYPFLDALYSAIEKSDFLVPTTLSGYLDRFGCSESLDYLPCGSWINGNLETWIGDPIKNRAWSMLSSAWYMVREVKEHDSALIPLRDFDPASSHLMRAEASDWFWWFGKGHTSIHEREFDFLFRQNLRMVYERIGSPTPEYLDRPVDPDRENLQVIAPSAFITPSITGRIESYYKWVGAGRCEFSHGSIYRLDPIISAVWFGYDRHRLFLRCDGFAPMKDVMDDSSLLRIHFAAPLECRIIIRPDGKHLVVEGKNGISGPISGAEAAVDEVLEVSLPVDCFHPFTATPMQVKFHVVLCRGDLEIERFPWDSSIMFVFDPDTLEVSNWML